MEMMIDGWTMMLATTALAGTILTLIVSVSGKYNNAHNINTKFLWLLWAVPKEIKMFTLSDIFLIIVYEILFGAEIVLSGYSLITNDINEIENMSSWCGMMIFIYIVILSIYVILLSYNAKRKNKIKTIVKVFNKEVLQNGNTKVGGGGALNPLIYEMFLLLALQLLIRIKQIFIMFSDRNMKLVFFISIIIILAIMIWLVLIKSERLHFMTIDKGGLTYRNWHGKLDRCATDKILRIEENGAYIFFFKDEKEIFAKFNILTKGLNELLDVVNLNNADIFDIKIKLQ